MSSDNPFEIDLESPKLEIVRDVYQTMNRRLEHYRQLATGAIFGTVAIFILAVGSVERWRQTAPPKAPAGCWAKLNDLSELLMMLFVVTAIVFFAIRMIKRASSNFSEVASIILKAESLFRIHDIGVFIKDEQLYPAGWPHDFKKPVEWREDIIPLAEGLLWLLGILFWIYASLRAAVFL